MSFFFLNAIAWALEEAFSIIWWSLEWAFDGFESLEAQQLLERKKAEISFEYFFYFHT